MTFTKGQWILIALNVLYLAIGGIYFLKDLNLEFVIYVAVIVALVGGVFGTLRYTRFPTWMLALFSIWGLMHVLGGSVVTEDGVLFAYRIYPFIDNGELYVLRYDQVVHGYLYALVAAMTYHVVRNVLLIRGHTIAVFLIATMVSVGISGLNEIMEFLIAVNLERNGVGGYENAMLDLIFNFSGAVLATLGYIFYERSKT